ncbi:DUF726 domain-containing protein [uncultured Marinobacter sp.]|uniref:DUF726 domain-containing protein n=1 Tax=uncultured Marinobacter sp. TaxID=187379 RepID=UPI0030DBF17B
MQKRFNNSFTSARSAAEAAFGKRRQELSKRYKLVSSDIKERLDDPESVTAWCSWCGNHCVHNRVVERKVGRSTYSCSHCLFSTVACRYCDNMAKAASLDVKNRHLKVGPSGGRVSSFFKDNWTNELCSEHDGTTPDFSKANMKIADLSEFADLMKPRQKNYYGMAKSTAVIAGGAAIGTGAIFAAPGLAAAMGSAGLLGAAGTGKAISSVSGAAIASAAVAKLGVGGLAIMSAAGAGLGGKTGYGIANSYLKDIPDFNFVQVQQAASDSRHSVIVVNGLLSEEDGKKIGKEEWLNVTNDWRSGVQDVHDSEDIWLLNWEAKSLVKFGRWIGSAGNGLAAKGVSSVLALGSKQIAKRAHIAGWALTASEYLCNPWHSAMINAEKTGVMLAEAISRTEGQTFTLMGHSLGARVIFFALMALSTKKERLIKDVVLMGGAVGRNNVESWCAAESALTGTLYNCHSANDGVLKFLYQSANLGLSRPAGLGRAVAPAFNIDCTDFISGHLAWKKNLPKVLNRIVSLQ